MEKRKVTRIFKLLVTPWTPHIASHEQALKPYSKYLGLLVESAFLFLWSGKASKGSRFAKRKSVTKRRWVFSIVIAPLFFLNARQSSCFALWGQVRFGSTQSPHFHLRSALKKITRWFRIFCNVTPTLEVMTESKHLKGHHSANSPLGPSLRISIVSHHFLTLPAGLCGLGTTWMSPSASNQKPRVEQLEVSERLDAYRNPHRLLLRISHRSSC